MSQWWFIGFVLCELNSTGIFSSSSSSSANFLCVCYYKSFLKRSKKRKNMTKDDANICLFVFLLMGNVVISLLNEFVNSQLKSEISLSNQWNRLLKFIDKSFRLTKYLSTLVKFIIRPQNILRAFFTLINEMYVTKWFCYVWLPHGQKTRRLKDADNAK